MTTDLPTGARSDQGPRQIQRPAGRQRLSGGRWIKLGFLVIGLCAAGATAVILSYGVPSARQPGSRLTHTVTRGDLLVTVTEQGLLESSDNTEIKCKVRGRNTVTWVIENGSVVQPGDELVRLDTLYIEEQINERSKFAHLCRADAESWRARLARAELAIPEYLEGRYVAEMMTLEKDLAVAESNLRTAQNMLDHAQAMHQRGYRSELDVEEKKLAVKQTQLALEVSKTEIEVLDYTKAMELETLKGNLAAARAEFSGRDERAFADAARRDRALKELEHCVVKAERAGMVIHPTASAWKQTPEIEEGATVYKTQVLLLMPDLSKMQVKVGIRESFVDRIKPGLETRVTLPDRTLEAEVSSVSSIARPAGWWTGNLVRYDTVIELPPVEGLKPGSSAEVEVVIARHENVLLIPVAAVLKTEEGAFCWVETGDGPKRRSLRLGDTNEIFVVVEAGLKDGDEVALNPLAFMPEARQTALEPQDEAGQSKTRGKSKTPGKSKAPSASPGAAKPADKPGPGARSP